MKFEINKTLALKVLKVVDTGLVKGLGVATPGQMCVEAAVNYALGADHGDSPTCVGFAVRSFKIALNDCDWSSDAARAKGMRKLAIAQLGSDQINQVEFAKLLALRTTTVFLADFLRDKYPEHAARCAAAQDLLAARDAARDVASAARAASAARDAASAARVAARYVARAASYAASYAASAASDLWLTKMADIALGVLIELKSPGCAFLDLCD